MSLTIKWHGAKAKENARKAGVRTLTRSAEELLTRSNVLVPIEVGTPGLLSSGVPSVDEGALRAAVSYDTPYAVIQHEALDFQHDAGRQAKYLEDPLNSGDFQQAMQQIAAEEFKAAL